MPRFLPVLLLLGATLGAQELRGPDLTNYEVLAQALKNNTVPGLIIIDARPAEDYRGGHLPGAINLPPDRAFTEFPSKSAKTPLLVYGRPASSDARKVVDILKTRGYLNVIMFGSISQWKGDLQ